MKRVLNVYCDKNRKPKASLAEVFRGRPHLERLLDRSKPYLKKGKIGRQYRLLRKHENLTVVTAM